MAGSVLIGTLIVFGYAVMLAGLFVSMFSDRPVLEPRFNDPGLRRRSSSSAARLRVTKLADWRRRLNAGRSDQRVA